MDTLLNWIPQYGYPALFLFLMLCIVGLPIPDETLLTFSGYLIFKNQLALMPTMATACLGSICGITISYTIGRRLGLYFVRTVGRKLRIGTTSWIKSTPGICSGGNMPSSLATSCRAFDISWFSWRDHRSCRGESLCPTPIWEPYCGRRRYPASEQR